MPLDDFISTLQENNISQIICLVTQLVITIHTSKNLRKNKEQFPVKQLSPLLSLVALWSFFLLNCISFVTRIFEQLNDYYDPQYKGQIFDGNFECGQCRLYNHPEMVILSILYNGLRQLPLAIFIIKTYRVCLCYRTNDDPQLSNKVIALFSNQRKMLLVCAIMTALFMMVLYFVFGEGNPHYGNLIFQFFCPKESSIYDWIMIVIRFGAMAYVYIISIYTYNELDFKFFLILVFALTNTEVILRLFLALADITKTTYHQFYYHSFIMNLFGTLIMFYYSTIKEQRNRPLSLPILENFKAFLQNGLGYSVLTLYAEYLDKENNTKKFSDAFDAYTEIDFIMMVAYDNEFQIKDAQIPTIVSILNDNAVLRDLQDRQRLIQKCKKKELNSMELRNVERKLSEFCQTNIFYEWRQTESSKYLENEFRNNGVINLRMSTLGIGL